MIKRIVKMTFRVDEVGNFINTYSENWQSIKAFEGCRHVELLRDTKNTSVFFTYSLWESEQHLNAYRESSLFNQIWSSVKPRFSAKPEAWTVDDVNLGSFS